MENDENEEYVGSSVLAGPVGGIATVSKSLGSAAEACVACGWCVFPVSDAPPLESAVAHSRAMHPTEPMQRAQGSLARLRQPWATLATRDVNQVHTWWAEWPTALVGVATGSRSHLLALHMDADDTDVRHLLTDLPLTVTAQAGNVTDYYFEWPVTDAPIRDQTGYLVKGIHVRGEGQYVLAPPSLEGADTPYVWLHAPSDTPLAQLPVAMCDAILKRVDVVPSPTERMRIAAQRSLLVEAVEQVTSGSGKAREAAFWLAQRLKRAELDRIREATPVLYEFVGRISQSSGRVTFTQSDADGVLKLVYPGITSRRRRVH